ncbi:MAG: hypothetical protein H7832_08620 [Magnetococcus sp. DMHC-6]
MTLTDDHHASVPFSEEHRLPLMVFRLRLVARFSLLVGGGGRSGFGWYGLVVGLSEWRNLYGCGAALCLI